MTKVPRNILRDPERALSREWLVTNGIGGYASSSIIGVNTRHYHGLLVAAMPAPLGRQVVLSKVDEELQIGGKTWAIGCNEYDGNTIHPEGYKHLHSFHLDNGIPTFEYRVANAFLRKRVWMEAGRNVVYVRYSLVESEHPMAIRIRPFCAFRSYHGDDSRSVEMAYTVHASEERATVRRDGVPYPLRLSLSCGRFESSEDRYWNYLYRVERDRGFSCTENLYTPGIFSCTLSTGEDALFIASCEERLPRIADAFEREMTRREAIVKDEKSSLRRELLLAADQFVVRIPNGTKKSRCAILAGYHWFTDWGRDSMISLPGLLVSTGRFEEARDMLLEYARYIDQGMLPNRFADDGSAEYNTVDATLWYFNALYRYVNASGDRQIIGKLFPALKDVIHWHTTGTRYGIRMDTADALLRAGDGSSQLTWMDARVDGRPVTPRSGKPVEVNALWYNALCLMGCWARHVGESADTYESLAARCAASFRSKFWFDEGGYLCDVIDAGHGKDCSLRPNQVVAVSLPNSPLDVRQQRAVIDTIERELLTPYGLRTLSPQHSDYAGRYAGGPAERDSAYHQGAVWAWLLGQYADGHYRVYHDRSYIEALLKPFEKHLQDAGIGTISELFDADAPHNPGGCISQAWSIAEVLRVLTDLKHLG